MPFRKLGLGLAKESGVQHDCNLCLLCRRGIYFPFAGAEIARVESVDLCDWPALATLFRRQEICL